MPFKMYWYKKDYVIYFEFYGDTTAEDIAQGRSQGVRLTATYSPDKVMHNITNITRADSLPMSLRDMKNSFARVKSGVNVEGWSVVVGSINPFSQFLVSSLGQLFKFRFRIFKTLEEGLAFLNEVDSQLPPLLPIPEDFPDAEHYKIDTFDTSS